MKGKDGMRLRDDRKIARLPGGDLSLKKKVKKKRLNRNIIQRISWEGSKTVVGEMQLLEGAKRSQ